MMICLQNVYSNYAWNQKCLCENWKTRILKVRVDCAKLDQKFKFVEICDSLTFSFILSSDCRHHRCYSAAFLFYVLSSHLRFVHFVAFHFSSQNGHRQCLYILNVEWIACNNRFAFPSSSLAMHMKYIFVGVDISLCTKVNGGETSCRVMNIKHKNQMFFDYEAKQLIRRQNYRVHLSCEFP